MNSSPQSHICENVVVDTEIITYDLSCAENGGSDEDSSLSSCSSLEDCIRESHFVQCSSSSSDDANSDDSPHNAPVDSESELGEIFMVDNLPTLMKLELMRSPVARSVQTVVSTLKHETT